MKYKEIVHGTFIRRVNRFIAEVYIKGEVETVHVKNTGRLRELLVQGATVALEESGNPNRKTKFSLVGVKKANRWVNIDSQAPNLVVSDGLKNGRIKELEFLTIFDVKREVTFRKSRFDIFFKGEGASGFIEVKGVTLERNGLALFPDAPTARGTKHIYEMIEVVKEGYIGVLFFLIQMKGCRGFAPNSEMDAAFAKALREAMEAGVRILAYESNVTENRVTIGKPLPIHLA